MNVIGIDYQRTLSAACLREGAVPSWPPVSIGDGRRAVILNAAGGAAWSGDALARPAGERSAGTDSLAAGPWTDAAAAPFWVGLARRLRSFLGGADLGRHLQRTVVALTAPDFGPAAAAVKPLAAAAGLGEAVAIPSGDAALLAALGGPAPGGTAWPAVVAVPGAFGPGPAAGAGLCAGAALPGGIVDPENWTTD